jgi:hypothetical protein
MPGEPIEKIAVYEHDYEYDRVLNRYVASRNLVRVIPVN